MDITIRPSTSSGRSSKVKSASKAKKSHFRKNFGNLPFSVRPTDIGELSLSWSTQIEDLDLHHILPLVFSGLQELQDPYQSAATEAVFELLEAAGPKVNAVIPQLIQPIKSAINSKNNSVIRNVLRAVQELINCDPGAVTCLSQHYRHFLPQFNIIRGKRAKNAEAEQLARYADETLELLEIYGGEDSYELIKKMVPSYRSCMQPEF